MLLLFGTCCFLLAYLVDKPTAPAWSPNITYNQDNGTSYNILVNNSINHEQYVSIVRYILKLSLTDTGEAESLNAMQFDTLAYDGPYFYLAANTSALLVLPVSFVDHGKWFSVTVEYNANGELFNVTSTPVQFDFYSTFKGSFLISFKCKFKTLF